MLQAPSSTIDITTWHIRVRHNWEAETEDHWENPSEYPVMREVLHESVHFWQAVGLPYFLRIACAAYWDFQRVRAAAFGQDDARAVPLDQFELESGGVRSLILNSIKFFASFRIPLTSPFDFYPGIT